MSLWGKRQTRQRPGDNVPESLFGLDDAPATRLPSSKKSKKEAAASAPEETKEVKEKTKPSSKAGKKAVKEEPPPPPPPPAPTSDVVGQIARLTKAQWCQVAQIKMINRWADAPNVVSHKIIPPSIIEPHYFWIYWDTPEGHHGKDQCGWAVTDLNKHLKEGGLLFRKANSSEWVSHF